MGLTIALSIDLELEDILVVEPMVEDELPSHGR